MPVFHELSLLLPLICPEHRRLIHFGVDFLHETVVALLVLELVLGPRVLDRLVGVVLRLRLYYS